MLRGLPGDVAVGIRKPGRSSLLVPEMNLVFEADDELLAEDRSKLPRTCQTVSRVCQQEGFGVSGRKTRVEERLKIVSVGLSNHIGAAFVELEGYCGPGTEVWIYSPFPKDDRTKLLESNICSRQKALSNLTVHH